jgi:hypothetical protein
LTLFVTVVGSCQGVLSLIDGDFNISL